MNDLVKELREEADLCRNETAVDVANLLDKAAAEIERLQRISAGYYLLDAAISKIDYLLGEPNEMECSGYDVHKNEDEVVRRVSERLSRPAAEGAWEPVAWMTEDGRVVTAEQKAGMHKAPFDAHSIPLYISRAPVARDGVIEFCDVVVPSRRNVHLRSGSQQYSHAIVVSVEPFVLVSEEADMLWSATVKATDFTVIGVADPKVMQACVERWERDKASALKSHSDAGGR